jgi:hypothetical protein
MAEFSPAARAYITLKQQIEGVTDAMHNRPLRLTAGLWKRGGKRKSTTPVITHSEAAYNSFAKGRAKALANQALTARDHKSQWCVLGYYSTLTVLDMVGGRLNELHTDPATTKRATAEGAPRPAPVPVEPTDDPEMDDDDDDASTSAFFTPGHRIEYDNQFGEPGTIEVSADGKDLVFNSLKKLRGEPIVTDCEPIGTARSAWAQSYHRMAQEAGQ